MACDGVVSLFFFGTATFRPVDGEAAEVDDLGDGSTNDGGTPVVEADLREAAITDEKNLGPNAPGYIPYDPPASTLDKVIARFQQGLPCPSSSIFNSCESALSDSAT
jgi:hypothetical protein